MNKKRLLAIIMTVMLIVGLLPLSAFAEGDDTEYNITFLTAPGQGAICCVLGVNGYEALNTNPYDYKIDKAKAGTEISIPFKQDYSYFGVVYPEALVDGSALPTFSNPATGLFEGHFTMPDHDVTVTVLYREGSTGKLAYYYHVFLDADGNETDTTWTKSNRHSGNGITVPTKADDENNSYVFKEWQRSEASDWKRVYTPVYTAVPKIKCTVTADPIEGGTVTGGGSYAEGKTVTLTATPNPGYKFKEWVVITGNGGTLSNKDTNRAEFTMGTGDATLQAKFEEDPYYLYAIVYHLNDGTNHPSNPATYTKSDAITLANPTRDGYTFGGWYDNASFSGSDITNIPVGSTGDKQFYAKWTAETYNISYQNLKGASNSNPVTYTIADTPIPLVSPTGATGYTFDGWYDNAAFSGNAITEIPANSTGDKTFYAKWTADTYNISYQNVNGASNSNPATYTIADTPLTLADLTGGPTGETFGGWYDNAAFSGNVITEIPANSTGDKTFYAKWTADIYNISYQNLNGASNSNPATYTIADTPLTLAPLTGGPTGHTFDGWYDNASFSGSPITAIPAGITGDRTFYAKWTAETYNISYQNLKGASNSNPVTYTIADTPLTLAPLTGGPTGHTFDGWYDNAAFSGNPITEIPANSTGDKTFYAKWTADTYNISYQNVNGASNSNPATYTIDDTPLTLVPLTGGPTGHTFDGWYDNAAFSGNPITEIPANSTGDKTFYAKWTADTYNISYQNVNGASNSNPATYTIDDTPLTLVPLVGGPTGHTFDGWYDNAAFSGSPITAIPAGITGDRTFYAKWTADSYKITYNLNGGKSNHPDNPVSYTIEDTPITLAPPTGATGYSFDGWYDNDAYSGNAITEIPANSTGDKTFYAKWTEVSYSNTKGNGGEWTKGNKTTLTFTFKRSADDETTFSHFKGIKVDGKAVPEKDASGKANWTAKKGSVIIELQSPYLETLSVGEHKLAAQFDDGADATATFTVKAKPATPTVTPTKTPTKAATTSGKATTTAPKTGDESNMLLWFLLICASLFVMFQITSLRNRRFYDR